MHVKQRHKILAYAHSMLTYIMTSGCLGYLSGKDRQCLKRERSVIERIERKQGESKSKRKQGDVNYMSGIDTVREPLAIIGLTTTINPSLRQ